MSAEIYSNLQKIKTISLYLNFIICFSVYDVGGQQGERKKWIQVFDSVTAILFVVDCSSFDQTLREDPSKNRLLEALENFEQVWNNR